MRRAWPVALILALCGCASAWQDFKTSITPPESDAFGQTSRYESAFSGPSGARRVGAAACVRNGDVSTCTQRYSDGSIRRYTCRANGITSDCR